jgi:hypothetical protein
MDLKPLFDSLYDRLILPDFTGKIVPGLILLGVGFYIGAERGFWNVTIVHEMSAVAMLATLGAAWVTAFALQSCGELLRISRNRHLIGYYPPQFSSDREWYSFHLTIISKLKDPFRQSIERYVVIKEACGNAAMSLLASSLLYIIHIVIPGRCVSSISVVGVIPVALLNLFLIGFLLRMHHVHVRRQFEMTEALAATPDAQQGAQANSPPAGRSAA